MGTFLIGFACGVVVSVVVIPAAIVAYLAYGWLQST